MICTLLLVFAAPAVQQADPPEGPLRRDQLEISLYAPQRLEPEQLYRVAMEMFGRGFQVGDRMVDNLNMLYDSIVIYDLPSEVARIRAALAGLERSHQDAQGAGGASLPLLREIPLLDFHLRAIHTDTAVGALEPLLREVRARDEQGEEHWFPNLQVVDESVLLLRDNAEQLAAMRGLLERLDQPTPQVAVSAWVLRGGALEAPSSLPGELAKNLATLLPDMEFEIISRGLLQSSAEAGHEIMLRMAGPYQTHYHLELFTGAYDATEGRLTLASCRFHYDDGSGAGAQALFDTSTVLRHGEYTVIGLTGAEPVLLVLRFAALP